MSIELYRHQELALNYMRANEGFALFLEQGLGKTLCALIRVGELLEDGEIENCLIVCPKAVIGGWWGDVPLAEEYTGTNIEDYINVTNYEQLITKKGRKIYTEKQWDCVILDESHYIKNKSAKRTVACFQLAMKAKYRYILTGTR